MMTTTLAAIPILLRREIEARMVCPLAVAMTREMGAEKALSILGGIIDDLAFQGGHDLAIRMGGQSMADLAGGLDDWRAGGAYDLEILELSDVQYDFNITRCSYAEMYQALGMKELGVTLSCRRDFKLVEGFNPCMKLVRTQTVMEGAPFCDFRISMEDKVLPDLRRGADSCQNCSEK